MQTGNQSTAISDRLWAVSDQMTDDFKHQLAWERIPD
jgi:hypothetical protein